MTEDLQNKWPSRLVEILDFAEAEFLKEGYDQDEARRLAERAALAVAEVCGGHPIYMPKASDLKRALRNQKMYEKFNGHNYDQLARETGLCEQQVRKLINMQQQIEVARRQRSLI